MPSTKGLTSAGTSAEKNCSKNAVVFVFDGKERRLMKNYEELIENIENRNRAIETVEAFDFSNLTDEQIYNLWAKVILSGSSTLLEKMCNLLYIDDVEPVIELLQAENEETLSKIGQDFIEKFEEFFKTDYLSELVEWAQEEYAEKQEYIRRVNQSIRGAFARRMHDTVLGRIDPEGYSIDPDYDSEFDVNAENGIVLQKVIEDDQYCQGKFKRAEPAKLVENMIKEGFNISKCKTDYLTCILTRVYDGKRDKYAFSDREKACFDVIFTNGFDINKLSDEGFTLFRYAVGYNMVDAAEYFVEKGADPLVGIVRLGERYMNILLDIGFPNKVLPLSRTFLI